MGVIQIERYGNNPERDFLDEWSVEVTKELALQLLKHTSEFNYLLNCEKSGSQKEAQSSDSQNMQRQLPRPSQSGRDKTRKLKSAIERLLTENPL